MRNFADRPRPMNVLRPCAQRRAIVLLAALALAGSGLAAGAGKKAPRDKPVATLGGGATSRDAPILSLEQLRECMGRQDRLHADEAAMVGEQRDLDAEKAAIQQAGSALQGERAALDRTAASAVAAYNGKAIEHERRIDAYNARSKPFNERIEALKAEREGWQKDCGNRRYFEEDLAQIKAGR